MTKNEFIEGNRTIANFMGWKFYKKAKWYDFTGYSVDCFKTPENHFGATDVKNLKFHYSWDWLMPVVKKIMVMNFDAPFNGIMIDVKQDFYGDIRVPMLYNDINATYKLVVNFINIYNENKK